MERTILYKNVHSKKSLMISMSYADWKFLTLKIMSVFTRKLSKKLNSRK